MRRALRLRAEYVFGHMSRDTYQRLNAKAAVKRKRKPSVSTLIARAEKKGKTVTSITTPDGTVLSFGEPQPTEASNPWLVDLRETKQ